MGHIHISIFNQCCFWVGSGTFLPAADCVLGSVGFNGNTVFAFLMHFCCAFAGLAHITDTSKKRKMHQKHMKKVSEKKTYQARPA